MLNLELRTQVFDLVGPTCIVDSQMRLADWNPAFDEVLAIPLRSFRYQPATAYLPKSWSRHSSLDEWNQSDDSSGGSLSDQFEIDLPELNRTPFRRIITQLVDDNGSVVALAIHFVACDPAQASKIWSQVVDRQNRDTIWTKYASVYDELLLHFTDYMNLLEKVAKQMSGLEQCIDLGAGTGNSSLALLRSSPSRVVVAVDSSDAMLRRLRKKLDGRFPDRLQIFQCDIQSMPCFASGSFQGATMINTFYALPEPADCLAEVHRILSDGGTLVLTTSHSRSNVDRLFGRLKEDLVTKGLFELQSSAFQAARQRHEAMDEMIHRYSIDQIESMVTASGFTIEQLTHEYADAVIMIKAIKIPKRF